MVYYFLKIGGFIQRLQIQPGRSLWFIQRLQVKRHIIEAACTLLGRLLESATEAR